MRTLVMVVLGPTGPVDLEAENLGSGVMPCGIKVLPLLGDFGEVEVGLNDGLIIADWFHNPTTIRAGNTGSAIVEPGARRFDGLT